MDDVDPEWAAKLEVFRRSVDLRLDGEGNWFHDGEPFEHAGLIRLFDSGIDTHPDTGEPILRVGDKWCYFKADDVPFVVRRLRDEDGLVADLNNGESLPVPADAFESSGDHTYVQLSPTRRARLNRATQARLADWLEETADGIAVVTPSGRWPIRPA